MNKINIDITRVWGITTPSTLRKQMTRINMILNWCNKNQILMGL